MPSKRKSAKKKDGSEELKDNASETPSKASAASKTRSKRQKVEDAEEFKGIGGTDEAIIDVEETAINPVKQDEPKKLTNPKAKKLDEKAISDFPLFNGETMHLWTRKGEVANRIIICSDENTAWKLARYFDNPNHCIEKRSTRHFKTYTGLFQGVPISVLAGGMGGPMMDFAIRESKFCVDGPMAIIRFGTCCSISEFGVGDVVVTEPGSFRVSTNFDFIRQGDTNNTPYKISDIVESDPGLTKLLRKHVRKSLPSSKFCKSGLNGTTDSFYGSQGRFDTKFNDNNENLYNEILVKQPSTKTLEMEEYFVFSLAKMSREQNVYAASVSIVVINRLNKENKLDEGKLAEIEDLTGYSLFKALAAYDFPEGEPMYTVDMIKNVKANEERLRGGWNKPSPFEKLKAKNPDMFK